MCDVNGNPIPGMWTLAEIPDPGRALRESAAKSHFRE